MSGSHISMPSLEVMETRLRAACDRLIERGILAVGFPSRHSEYNEPLGLAVRLDGIEIDDAERLLTDTVRHRVELCIETERGNAESARMSNGWIFRHPSVNSAGHLKKGDDPHSATNWRQLQPADG